MSKGIEWKCSNCGRECYTKLEDPVCPSCGIRLASWATHRKHDYLKAVCSTNKYGLIIDACAGSGMLQYPDGKIRKGSPAILEEIVKDKMKLVCIEVRERTCEILAGSVKNAQIINDDCNNVVPRFANGKTPTLVFLDPQGYGIPPIKRSLVLNLSKTPKTDLLIQYSWRIAREMGFCRKYLVCDGDNCPSELAQSKDLTCDNCYNRGRATAWKKSLDIWWGDSGWMNWGSMTKSGYAEAYSTLLREHNKVEKHLVKGDSPYNTYHLIFATKFNLPLIGLRKWFYNMGKT